MLIRLFQHTTICWGLGLKRDVRKVDRIADAVVRGRSAGGSEAKESLEGSHGLLSAIVPKDELVEVGLELRAADPVMSADERLLEVADGAIGEWHHRRRTFAQFGSQRLSARDVLEAEFLQASKASRSSKETRCQKSPEDLVCQLATFISPRRLARLRIYQNGAVSSKLLRSLGPAELLGSVCWDPSQKPLPVLDGAEWRRLMDSKRSPSR